MRRVPLVLAIHVADARTGEIVDTITATREHPFYVQGKGFVPAGGLAVGNAIITRAGLPLVVKSIEYHRRPEGYKVYNLVVEDDHTYFIGKANGGLWIHNPRCGMLGNPATRQQDAEIADELEREGWTVTHGGGRGKQELMRDPNMSSSGRRGRPRNSVYPDITATKDGRKLRIQTVDVNPDGTPTEREADNLIKILIRDPSGEVIWIPKNR